MNNKNKIKVLPQFKKNKSLENKQIVLLGFGVYGRKIFNFATSRGYQILEIWDNYPKISEYNSVKVCKPHNNLDENIPVIISAHVAKLDKILFEQAQQLGYVNVLNFVELFIGEDLSYLEYGSYINIIEQFKMRKMYSKKNNLFILPQVQVQITEKCSLKCKECGNLMQYYENPQHLDLEQTLKDIDRLLKSVDYIENVVLLGGEPFVCNNLYKYVEFLKQYDNIGIIMITTNGTIIPQNKNLDCLKSEKVQIKISNYGKTSKKFEQLKELFQKEHIFYDIINYESWFAWSKIEKCNRTMEENNDIFNECSTKWCLTLRNSKFFRCPFIANSWALKAIPSKDIEFVDLDTDNYNSIRKNIKEYLDRKSLLTCDYCIGHSMKNRQSVPVAEQIHKPLEYKKYI